MNAIKFHEYARSVAVLAIVAGMGTLGVLVIQNLNLVQGQKSVDDKALSDNAAFPEGVRFDAGAVDRGITITHMFKIQNPGPNSVTVDLGPPSCSCSSVRLVGPKNLQPQQSTQVEIKMDTGGSKGGEIMAYIPLRLLPNDTTIRLELIAYVRDTISTSQDIIDFGDLYERSGRHKRTLSVHYDLNPDFTPTMRRAASDNPAISVDANEPSMLEARSAELNVYRQRLSITLDTQSIPNGPLWSEILIESETASGELSVLKVPVKANILSQVKVRPSCILITPGGHERGEVIRRTLNFEMSSQVSFSRIKSALLPGVDSVSFSDPVFSSDRRRCTLGLSFIPPDGQLLDSSLQVEFEEANKQTTYIVTIPVRVLPG